MFFNYSTQSKKLLTLCEKNIHIKKENKYFVNKNKTNEDEFVKNVLPNSIASK